MLTTLIIFFVILSILVLVHELGHFIVAKKAGIRVEEFGFGLPPRVWGKKIGETIYSLNALPIGGFVRLAGEDPTEKAADDKEKERMFWAKSKKARAAVIIAGVVMNFLLAVTVFSIVYAKTGIPTQTNNVRIIGISPDSPAQLAGVKEDDIIVKADNLMITGSQMFIEATKNSNGKEMTLEVKRQKDNPCNQNILGAQLGIILSCNGENLVLKITPRQNPPEGEGPLGVAISQTEMKFYPFYKQVYYGVIQGTKEAFSWVSIIVSSLGTMVGQLIKGSVPKDVAGPVGIFQATGIVAQTGILSLMQFLGILSINLAVMNILPLPALDGGRLVMIGFEAITRRKVKPKIEQWLQTAGMAFLLLLILLVTINDVVRIITTSGVLDRLRSFFTF